MGRMGTLGLSSPLFQGQSRKLLSWLFLFALVPEPCFGIMTDLPLPLPLWETSLPEEEGFLTQVHSRFSVGTIAHDSLAERLRWSGSGEGEILLLSRSRLHWEWRLSMETLADDRNEIYFRVLRLYYLASTGLRLKAGEKATLYVGYQHRCSHGSDFAEPGRILIRSGPRLSLTTQANLASWAILFNPFWEGTLIGQNADPSVQARHLLAGLMEAKPSQAPFLFGAGSGIFLLSQGTKDTFSAWGPWGRTRAFPVYHLLAGLRLSGKDGIFTLSLRWFRVLDTGLKNETTPASMLGLFFHFDG